MMRLALIFFIYEKLFQYGSIIAARHYSDSACKPAVVQSSPKVSACVYACICDVQLSGWSSTVTRGRVPSKVQHKINNVLRVFIAELSYFYHFIFLRNAVFSAVIMPIGSLKWVRGAIILYYNDTVISKSKLHKKIMVSLAVLYIDIVMPLWYNNYYGMLCDTDESINSRIQCIGEKSNIWIL